MKIIHFADYPDFTPNMTPYQMFNAGIMGGSYFRNITSPITHKTYKNHDKKFDFLKKIPLYKIKNNEYNKFVNKYKVKVGSSYEFWMEKKWINEKIDPYGWIEWYCNFYKGRRTIDDERQINRWRNIAGNNGRFKVQLQNKLKNLNEIDNNNFPKIRQILLHWALDTSKMK